MSKGMAICLGLNRVDPNHYQGWDGQLNACEADAQDMSAIAKDKQLAVTTLLSKKATRDAVLKALAGAAKQLVAGDLLVFTYSGHGGQLPDRDGDEDDGMDETWCLYDGEISDDELYEMYCKFAKGVRILVLSDSCHSGTVARDAQAHQMAMERAIPTELPPRFRTMPGAVALRTYQANKKFYDDIAAKTAKAKKADPAASILLISGCQDNQLSQDGTFNGLFTAQLLKVWNGGKYSKTYRNFHSAILAMMPPDQSPNYFYIGPANKAFEKGPPFSV